MINLDALLRKAIEENASDLHLCVGAPPVMRIGGKLERIGATILSAEDTKRIVTTITPVDLQERAVAEGGVDFCFGVAERARFRTSVYTQQGSFALALRLLPTRLMTLEEIGLPPLVTELLSYPRGLILVTGPTGCGKTTTLAAMISKINRERECHILTIEDPIEYHHPHGKAIVTQREIGPDVPDFSEALMRGLRQDPDVILVGEMRDLATMKAAMSAAETGHLVFATLHTTGAGRTVDRIVDAFPSEQQAHVRVQVSQSLVAVISQVLLVRANRKGRIAAFEIMVATPSIRNLIRENKTFLIHSDIQTGAKRGMKTLDMSLMELYRTGEIDQETLLAVAQDPGHLVSRLGLPTRSGFAGTTGG